MGFGKISSTEENAVSIGTQAWNIADGYTKIKILRIIIQLDIDEEIAMFGKKDDLDLINLDEIPYKRVESFEKMIFHLRQLIGNCEFAIEKLDNKVISDLYERIKNVENVQNGISDFIINDITKEKELRINEEHFRRCMKALSDIKNVLNFPVNRAGLIFRQSDEMDLDEIMRDIEEGG